MQSIATTKMSNLSDYEARTFSNSSVAVFTKRPSAEISLVPLTLKSLQRKETWEPKPFRKGASLKLLPGSGNIFVLVGLERRISLEPYVSSAIECISGSEPSEVVSRVSVREDQVLSLSPESSVIVRETLLPLPAVPLELSTNTTLLPLPANKECAQKFPKSQDETWEERFQELLKFKKKHGHCLVPHGYDDNQSFARWAKRQRFQYKQLRNHKPSSMTQERINKLESVGFVWDPQTLAWEARLIELMDFKMAHGHCNVPCRHAENPALGAWVKRQRRQYKKYMGGSPTNIPPDRFRILIEMGFQWEIRSYY